MSYDALASHFHRISQIQGALGILHWDSSTVMPKGSGQGRGEQLATLTAIAHEMTTDARIEGWLEDINPSDLDEWQRANVSEIERSYTEATALPTDLVEHLSRACSECELAWRTARGENDFAGLQPKLDRVIELVREKAKVLSDISGASPYDALLSQYDPGTTSAEIDQLFAALEEFLPELLQEVIEKQNVEPLVPPEGPFSVEQQKALGLKLMGVLGFDFDQGRLDVSAHPFCGGTPQDVRITTRYSEDDFTKSLMGVIHETGHALYELGLPRAWVHQPVGRARGMSFHESQSLLMEMQACRSREFLEFAAPLIRDAFGGSGAGWSTQNLYRLYTQVSRGLIRVDADEVSYPLHVILRYRLEQALLSGDLKTRDLPTAWSDGMHSLLGVTPPDDSDGCMQDIHWYGGALGYFPTYTLGAMKAAQLFNSAKRQNTAILPGIQRGDFQPLVSWLRDNVHGQASRYSQSELMIRATGEPLSVEIFRRHLEQRYLHGE